VLHIPSNAKEALGVMYPGCGCGCIHSVVSGYTFYCTYPPAYALYNYGSKIT